MSRTARPIVAFALKPGPNTLPLQLIPIEFRTGPFTMTSGADPFVLQATRTDQEGSTLLTVVSPRGEANLPRLIEALTQEGALIQKLAPEEPTLEDVFVELVGRSMAEEEKDENEQQPEH